MKPTKILLEMSKTGLKCLKTGLISAASHLWHGRFAVHGELEGHLVGAVVVGGLAGEETLVLPGHRVQLQLGLVLLAVVHQHTVLGVVHQLGPAHKPSGNSKIIENPAKDPKPNPKFY